MKQFHDHAIRCGTCGEWVDTEVFEAHREAHDDDLWYAYDHRTLG